MTEAVGLEDGPVREFALTLPFPGETDTPHHLVRPHECAVYRFYDVVGDLLYVGISWNPYRRWAAHRRRAAWFARAARVLVDVYESERDALRIEREWIRNASPSWNVRSATG